MTELLQKTKTGGQLLFESALRYGVTHVFGNPGTTEVNFMNALSQFPDINFFLCLHEDIATGAADGYARMTGKPAMVNVHLAPGLTNGMANIHNAKRARNPMIVTIGDHHTQYELEDSALAGNIVGLANSMCKWGFRVPSAADIPAAMHRAMLEAMTPPRGPVCLILPNNVLSQETDAETPIPHLHIPKPGMAHPDALKEAAAMLQASHKPMIVVGEVESLTARRALLDIARAYGASIWRELSPTRLDPATDPLHAVSQNRLPYIPHQRREVLRNCDCLLLAGVSNFTGLFMYDDDPIPTLVPDALPVIHIEADKSELGKNAKSALPLWGDVDLSVIALRDELGIKAGSDYPIPVTPKVEFNIDDSQPLTPAVLGRALRVAVPPGTIFVDESITSGQGISSEFVKDNFDLKHILTQRGGALGNGLPSSIGVQIASPGQPVLASSGDGTAVYVIQYLWTLARYRLPVVAVICSNHNYDIITIEIMRAKGALASSGIPNILQYTGITNPNVNFAALAEGFGVKGYTVTKPSELVPAITEAFASGKPALIDVSLAPTLR